MDKHPAVALVSQMGQLVDDAGRIPLLGLSGPELDAVIEDQFRLISRLTVQLTELLDQAEVLDRPAELAAPSMVAWLRGRFGQTPQDASRLIRDLKALRAAPVAADAALLGAIPIQAAAAIGQAVTDLPLEVGPELRAEGEDVLLGFAVGRDGPELHAREPTLVGRHLYEVLDPDAADQLLAARLEREEAATYRRRFLSITDDHDGGVRLRGLLTTEAAATLRAVLDPLAAPRPAVLADAQPTTPGPDPAGGAPGDGRRTGVTTNQEGEDLLRDERTGGQRLADALIELADRALTQGDLPVCGGQRPQLLVTLDYDQLASGLGAGRLADGSELSPAAVRRLACDAGIVPAVLGTAGQVLDLGRSARTASPAQRRALALRDGGCDFPGCDRPPSWTEAHHIQHWEDFGPTDLENLVALCSSHHRDIHSNGWEIIPPKDGIRPLFVPPPWIDPQQRPRRNTQHHTRDLLRPLPSAERRRPGCEDTSKQE